jgi:hypothetical protein
MPIEDQSYSTLAKIRNKIRKLTRSPSASQISDTELDEYINTFVLYDFPEQLRLDNLRKKIVFYTEPYIDTYSTNTTDPANALYNFSNRYISVHDPVYVMGSKIALYQTRESFFNSYPQINQLSNVGTGTGLPAVYSGTLASKPILRNSVLFDSIDANNNGLALKDNPLAGPNHDATLLDIETGAVRGTLNYVTGLYSFSFIGDPKAGSPVNIQSFPYTPALPRSILFYEGEFVIRPIPDQSYRVELEAYVRPTEFLSTVPTQMPELSEWWQYISYGAAIKIFQDRMDQESAQLLMPEFKNQEVLILRRTIVQHSNERVATIFTESEFFGANNPFGGGGGLV